VGEERLLRHKLTQQDIADRVGSSREMVLAKAHHVQAMTCNQVVS
jgi:transcriptional regulator with XRE-family HTH domain